MLFFRGGDAKKVESSVAKTSSWVHGCMIKSLTNNGKDLL